MFCVLNNGSNTPLRTQGVAVMCWGWGALNSWRKGHSLKAREGRLEGDHPSTPTITTQEQFQCRGAGRSPKAWAVSPELVNNQTPPKACILCLPNDMAPEIPPGWAGSEEGSQVPKMDPLVYLLPDSGES